MSVRLRGTAKSRLLTGVRVMFGCYLVVGIWKGTSFLVPRESHEPPAPAVEVRHRTIPSPAPPVSPKDNTVLLAQAVEAQDEAAVKTLLERGTDPNGVVAGEEKPLSTAALNGDLKIAKLLLRYGAEVNPKGSQSPLAYASYSSNALPMMRLLIHAGANVNARFDKNTTVMSIARFHGGDEAVALLKTAGARR